MGLTYKLIGGNFIYFPVEQVCLNRGITPDLFELDDSFILGWRSLDNIKEGVNLLLKHLDNNGKIVIVVD